MAIVRAMRVCGARACVGLLATAQDVKEFEKRTSEFTLPNGLQFVVVERHDSPAVSFHTYVRAGSADDGAGRTGLAWLLEEALFTGTETIGSKNWAEEKKAMDAIETAYDEIEAERNLGVRTSQDRIDRLQSQLRIASEAASRLGMRGSYTTLLDENGGTRPSVSTSPDGAECTYTMPSN